MMATYFGSSLLAAITITLFSLADIQHAEAQSCTMGFLSTVSECTSSCGTRQEGSTVVTRIIPDMMFTCTGTVVKWRAAGMYDDRSVNAMLDIWREKSGVSGTYDKVATIELGTCGSGVLATEVTRLSDVYECILPESLRVSVQPGDVVGIEIARNMAYDFRLYFDDTNGGPTNYVFNGQFSTVTMSQFESASTSQDQPQISLTVEMAVQTTESSTTTQLPTTTIAPTTELTTAADTTLGEAQTTTVVMESSTMAATTESLTTQAATTMEAENVPTTSQNIDTTPEDPTSGETTEKVLSTADPLATTDTPATSDAHNVIETDGPTTTDVSTDTPATMDPASNVNEPSGGDNGSNNFVATVVGALVGVIIAILLVVLIVLLPFLILRRQRDSQKYDTRGTNILNPVYDENIAVRMPDSNQGMVGVYSMVNCDHAPTDYEDIDTKPNIPSFDMPESSGHDYSKTPHPLEMSCYEIPVATLTKGLHNQLEGISSGNYDSGVLYVPSQEQRKNLPDNVNNEGIYSAIGMSQYGDAGPTPMLFEENDTYWVPASDANELYSQLSSRKYREIIRQQIQITSHLGAGQFGTVNKGIWQSPMGAMDVAVKQLQSGASEEEKVKFLQEAAINGQFRHPNVVKLMGVVTVGEPVMIVLELLSYGDLHNYLLKLQPSPGEILPSNTRSLLLKFCQQVAAGMEYLSRKAFVHRDLAARNILVGEDKTCKISDFGMSRDLMDENYYVSHGGKVPVKWTAPEAINFKKYSSASDVWSFGCVMYEIWSLGHKPFESYRNPEVIQLVDRGCRLPPPPGLPKELYKMMIQCWHGERSRRPTFPQLVELLSRTDFELFVWEEEDLIGSDPQVKMIGAPLDVASNLYVHLQKSYLNNVNNNTLPA